MNNVHDNKKKKIVIATDCFMPRIDGIARFLEMLLPHLADYKMIVIAPDFKGEFNRAGYSIKRVALRKIMIGDYIPPKKPSADVLSLIDDADLIFCQTTGPIGGAVIDYAYKLDKKIISFVHSIEWILVEKSLSRTNLIRSIASFIVKIHAKSTYNKCNAIIVPSRNVGEIFSARGMTKKKYVVHMGIDTEKFRPSDKAEAKKELGFKEDDFVIGYVGRIAREKSLLTLRKAFKRVEGNNNKLLIVGEGICSLKNKLKANDKHDNIIITGKTEDVVKYLNAMDVFVMPSLTETSCLALLEAMSCQLPTISTKVGNIKDYLIDRQNGLFFPKENHMHLAIKLNYLKENPDFRRTIAINARQTILKNYNYSSMINSIKKVLQVYLEE